MNATIEAAIENTNSEKCTADIMFEQSGGDDDFFKGLIQRARYYEQFEDRKTRITYSVTQTNIEAYS